MNIEAQNTKTPNNAPLNLQKQKLNKLLKKTREFVEGKGIKPVDVEMAVASQRSLAKDWNNKEDEKAWNKLKKK